MSPRQASDGAARLDEDLGVFGQRRYSQISQMVRTVRAGPGSSSRIACSTAALSRNRASSIPRTKSMSLERPAAALRTCSGCGRFIAEPAQDLPAFGGLEDSGERAALAEALTLLALVEQSQANLGPVSGQQPRPLFDRRGWRGAQPATTGLPCPFEPAPLRIGVDARDDGAGELEAAQVDFVVRSHQNRLPPARLDNASGPLSPG